MKHLSEAWRGASADPIAGIDQTADAFRGKVYAVFVATIPVIYQDRNLDPVINRWYVLAAEMQKFQSTVRLVTSLELMGGVSEAEALNIAVAHILKKRTW